MQLRYISMAALIAEAGGDPWAINESLQAGRPAQISDLAQAFHAAGRCTTESSNAFDEARRRFEASWNRENGENPINDSAEVQRVTKTLGAQSLQLPKIGADLENIAAALAESQRTGAVLISTLEGQLQQLDNEIGQAVEEEKDVHLTAGYRRALDALISSLEQQAIDDTKSAQGQLESLRNGYSDYLQKSLATLRTDGYDPALVLGDLKNKAPVVEPVDFKTGGGSTAEDLDRRRASEEAFKQVFGRPPTSPIDWETAEALNPNSYDPKYQGVKPEIRVVRIRPVPGQGLVRSSQYIEQRDVTSGPGTRDFGDGRTANPNFDPENARVTTYVDYENGIVVMRQNPSVQLNENGGPGAVKVGVPDGRVWQNPDGSVRIQYSAANPFAPDIARHPPGPLANNPITVNGDLVFTPGAQGVHVDGTRTDYPSLEVYQDLPNGQSRTVLIDPAQSGSSLGPATNLQSHHEIGSGGLAFRAFTEWNYQYDVPGNDKPSTGFGPETRPPAVPPTPVPAGTTEA
ncbi:MAG TPA: hypothetical protein VG327_10525 [Mycobacterium sp.]|nr:hypothetical protein [Mycobacterium sp.]